MNTHEEYIKSVTEIVADQIGCNYEDLVMDQSLREQGADSLDDVELIMAFEEEFDIEVDDADAEGLKTVNDIVAYLEKTLGVQE